MEPGAAAAKRKRPPSYQISVNPSTGEQNIVLFERKSHYVPFSARGEPLLGKDDVVCLDSDGEDTEPLVRGSGAAAAAAAAAATCSQATEASHPQHLALSISESSSSATSGEGDEDAMLLEGVAVALADARDLRESLLAETSVVSAARRNALSLLEQSSPTTAMQAPSHKPAAEADLDAVPASADADGGVSGASMVAASDGVHKSIRTWSISTSDSAGAGDDSDGLNLAAAREQLSDLLASTSVPANVSQFFDSAPPQQINDALACYDLPSLLDGLLKQLHAAQWDELEERLEVLQSPRHTPVHGAQRNAQSLLSSFIVEILKSKPAAEAPTTQSTSGKSSSSASPVSLMQQSIARLPRSPRTTAPTSAKATLGAVFSSSSSEAAVAVSPFRPLGPRQAAAASLDSAMDSFFSSSFSNATMVESSSSQSWAPSLRLPHKRYKPLSPSQQRTVPAPPAPVPVPLGHEPARRTAPLPLPLLASSSSSSASSAAAAYASVQPHLSTSSASVTGAAAVDSGTAAYADARGSFDFLDVLDAELQKSLSASTGEDVPTSAANSSGSSVGGASSLSSPFALIAAPIAASIYSTAVMPPLQFASMTSSHAPQPLAASSVFTSPLRPSAAVGQPRQHLPVFAAGAASAGDAAASVGGSGVGGGGPHCASSAPTTSAVGALVTSRNAAAASAATSSSAGPAEIPSPPLCVPSAAQQAVDQFGASVHSLVLQQLPRDTPQSVRDIVSRCSSGTLIRAITHSPGLIACVQSWLVMSEAQLQREQAQIEVILGTSATAQGMQGLCELWLYIIKALYAHALDRAIEWKKQQLRALEAALAARMQVLQSASAGSFSSAAALGSSHRSQSSHHNSLPPLQQPQLLQMHYNQLHLQQLRNQQHQRQVQPQESTSSSAAAVSSDPARIVRRRDAVAPSRHVRCGACGSETPHFVTAD